MLGFFGAGAWKSSQVKRPIGVPAVPRPSWQFLHSLNNAEGHVPVKEGVGGADDPPAPIGMAGAPANPTTPPAPTPTMGESPCEVPELEHPAASTATSAALQDDHREPDGEAPMHARRVRYMVTTSDVGERQPSRT